MRESEENKTKERATPAAKDWRNLPIEQWNTLTFHAYAIELHEELFGVEYEPFGSWPMEQRLLVGLIGNADGTKQGTHDKRLIRDFITYTFRNYSPSAKFPGTSFGFMWKYRQGDLRKVVNGLPAEYDVELQRKAQEWREMTDNDVERTMDWF